MAKTIHSWEKDQAIQPHDESCKLCGRTLRWYWHQMLGLWVREACPGQRLE